MHFFYQVHPYDLFACTSGHMEYTAHIHAQLEMMYVTKGAVDFTINGESTRLHAIWRWYFRIVRTISPWCRNRRGRKKR